MYPVIDWNHVWREMMEENLATRSSSRCSTYWDCQSRAADYLRSSREEGLDRIKAMIGVLALTSDSRVLDIGAGPGTLSLPLAPKVRSITAVEPAEPMANLLREEADLIKAENITIIQKHWEDTTASDLSPPYDLVIAAYSLGVTDLRSAIQQMQEVCSGTIYIFLSAGIPFWEEMLVYLWPHLHNSPYFPGPKMDVIWNLLYNMGICADVRVTPLTQVTRYASIEDAVDEYSPRMLVSETWQRDLLRQYIKNRLSKREDHYLLTGTVRHTCISWKC